MDEEDPSIDVNSKDRGEILAGLQQLGVTITQSNTARLRQQLKCILMERHPIHERLENLPHEEVKCLDRRTFWDRGRFGPVMQHVGGKSTFSRLFITIHGCALNIK